jgi:hypothetical protein
VIKTSPPACTDNWVGSTAGGAWSTLANWSNGLPAAGAVACIPGGTGQVTFNGASYANSTCTIAVLISGAPLDVTSGELTLSNTSVESSVDGLTMSGGQIGDQTTAIASLLDNGPLTWSGGYFESPTTESPQPVVSEPSGFAATISAAGYGLYNWTLSLASPLNVSGSTGMQTGSSIQDSAAVVMANNAVINGGASGSFDILPNGSLTIAAANNTAAINVPVQVNGPITLLTGDSLTVGDGQLLPSGAVSGSVAAALTVPAGATLVLNGVSLQTQATNSGAGTLQFGGTLLDEVAVNVANVTEAGPGTTTAFAGLNITGTLTVQGGELDPLAATNDVGLLTMTGGQIGDTVNPTGNITDAGNFSWTGASFYAPAGQIPQPTMTETGGSGSIASPSYLQHWTLDFTTSLNLSGAFQCSEGGSIVTTSTVNVGSSTSIGNYNSSAGPFVASGAVKLASTATTATIAVPINISGTLSLQTTGSQVLVLGNGGQGSGSVTGAITVGSGTTLDLNGVSLGTGASFTTSPPSTGTLETNGNVVASVPIKVTTVNVQSGYTYAAAGLTATTLTVSGGEFDPAPSTTVSAATMTLSAGQIGDTTNLIGNVSVTGTLTWSGGSLYAPAGEIPQPQLTVGGGVNQSSSETLDHWTLQVGKTLGITGTVYADYGGSITVLYDGNSISPNTVSIAAGASVIDYSSQSSGLFTSNVKVLLASGTASIQTPVDFTDGVGFSAGGTLTLGNSSVPCGSINTTPFTVGAGDTLVLDNVSIGTGATQSGTGFSSPGTLDLQGTVVAQVPITVNTVNVQTGVTYADAGAQIGGALNVSGGEFDPLATSTVNGLFVSGGQVGDNVSTVASITDNGTLNWSGGSFVAPAGETPQPSVSTTTPSSIANPSYDLNWALNFSSAASLALSGTFYLGEDGTINAAGAVSITTSLNLTDYYYYGYGGYFTASGLITVNLGTGTTAQISVPVQVTGGVQVVAGTFTLGANNSLAYGSISSQPFSVASGAFLNFENVNILAGATNSGAGTLQFYGAVTSAVPLNVANITEQGGTTYAQGGVVISGTLLVNSGEFDPVQGTNTVGILDVAGGQVGDSVTNTGSITDAGAFNWTGGSFVAPAGENPQPSVTTSAGSSISNPSYDFNWSLNIGGTLALSGTFYLAQGGTINASGQVNITAGTNVSDYYYYGYGGYFNSTGGIDVNLSTGTAALLIPVSITGGLTVQLGSLTLGNSQVIGSINSAFSVGSAGTPTSATLLLDDVNIGPNASNSGTGTLYLEGSVHAQQPITVDNVVEENGGTTVASGGFQISGTLNVQSGEFDPLAGAAANTAGTLDLSGGNLGDTTSSVAGISVGAGGFDWTSGSLYAPAGENPQPAITTSASSVINNPSYDSNWALNFSGALALSGSFYLTNGGTIVASGAVTAAAGTYIGNPSTPTAGPFVLTSTGSLALPAVSGSPVRFDVTLENNGIVNLGRTTFNMYYGYYVGGSGSTLETSVAGLSTGQYGSLICNYVPTSLGGTLTVNNIAWTPATGQTVNVVTNTTSSTGFDGTSFANSSSNGWTFAQITTNNNDTIQLQG